MGRVAIRSINRDSARNSGAVPIFVPVFLIFLLTAVSHLYASPSDCPEKEIHNFLIHQRNDKSGILESFINSDDLALTNQASTYDMALAGLGFLKLFCGFSRLYGLYSNLAAL